MSESDLIGLEPKSNSFKKFGVGLFFEQVRKMLLVIFSLRCGFCLLTEERMGRQILRRPGLD